MNKMVPRKCQSPKKTNLPPTLQPTYGWAMRFGKGYETMSDIVRTSSYYTSDSSPLYFSSDGYLNGDLPQYELKTYPTFSNCPYYNYTLPDTYPYVASPSIKPQCYWYLPYDTYDAERYMDSNIISIPKSR